jgi:flagellar assembly protein FliH
MSSSKWEPLEFSVQDHDTVFEPLSEPRTENRKKSIFEDIVERRQDEIEPKPKPAAKKKPKEDDDPEPSVEEKSEIEESEEPEEIEPPEPTPEELAEEIIAQAKQQAKQIEREAFEKGYAGGERAGQELAKKAVEKTLAALNEAVESLRAIAQKRVKEVEDEEISLAVAVARKIIHREIQQDPYVIVDIVRSALSKSSLGEQVVVKVHPQDKDILSESHASIVQDLEEVRALNFEADETLERGEAIVECALGELDLRIERQIQEVERTFEKILNERADEAES